MTATRIFQYKMNKIIQLSAFDTIQTIDDFS